MVCGADTPILHRLKQRESFPGGRVRQQQVLG